MSKEDELVKIFNDCRRGPDEYGFESLDEEILEPKLLALIDKKVLEARIEALEEIDTILNNGWDAEIVHQIVKDRLAELKSKEK